MERIESSLRPDLELSPISWLTRASEQQQNLAATIAVAVLLVVFFYRSTQKDRQRLPPGPRPWPIIGNLGLLSPLAHQDFQKLAKKYGPIFHFRLGSKDAIIVSSPKIAEEILRTHDVAFASRPTTSQFEFMLYGGQTIVTASYGPFWRHARKVFTLELVTAKRIQQFQNVRKEEVLSTVCSMFEECKDGKTVSLNVKLYHLLMNNITRMMMNRSYFGPNSSIGKTEAAEVEKSLKELVRLTGVFHLGDYVPLLQPFDLQGNEKQMRALGEKNDKFFQRIVDEHRQKLGSEPDKDFMDFVDVLLTRPTGKEEKPLTDTQIKGMLLSALLGGTDTSSNTMLWGMTQLLKHPNVLKRAQDELDAVVGRDRLVEEADIPNLKYFGLIVKEIYRLHPVGPLMIPHECTESREVAGYHIPVMSQVLINVYAIQRDPDVWERPLEFDPERFLSTNIDIHGQDFELLPFGSGRRSCPGKPLGTVLVDYILAVLLHASNWSLPPGVNPQDVDLGEASGTITSKKIPLEAIASPRLPMDIIYGNLCRKTAAEWTSSV